MADRPTWYKISLEPRPVCLRFFSNRRESYLWQYTDGGDRCACEIKYLQEGSLSEMRADGEHTYRQGTVHTTIHNRNFQQYSKDPVLHEFLMLFVIDPPVPVTAEEVLRWGGTSLETILPESITDPVACERIGSILKATVPFYTGDQAARGLRMRAAMYEILAILAEQAALQAREYQQQVSNRRSRITIRACNYIQEHLAEKLQVREVALAAGVSYDHLRVRFHQEMDMTLVEYITRSRIRRTEQLITVEGMTLAQAGAAVGIPEPKYLSRLFHEYTGMTVRQFRQIYQDRRNSGFSLEA